MKVLRVFYILRTYHKAVENKKAQSTEHRYKAKPCAADFDESTDPQAAYDRIYREYGKPPENGFHAHPVPRFAEVVTHTIVDNDSLTKDSIKSEKYFEQPLFDGITYSETLGEKK